MYTCEEKDEAGSVAAELLELVAALDDEINCGKTCYFQIPYGITKHKRGTRTVMVWHGLRVMFGMGIL